MPTKRILVKQEVATYAQCLLEAAQAADRVFEDIEDIKNVRTAVVKSSQVREFLQNPNVPAENKSAFVKDAFSGFAPEVAGVVAVKKLSADLGHGVRLNESVDASILGGIIISTHGKRMDASVKTQLNHARQVLKTASTGGEE